MKWELEDLSFKALDPERYRELAANLDTRRHHRETYIDRAMAILTPELEKAGIVADLNGRPKHLYSIWKKMQRKAAAFGEIYDVYAIRLLVDEVRDCYAALGVVHSLWKPIPGQFDDYIAVPKPNGYQSLHTAVIALDGKPLEIQIRTHAMHAVSEVGIAAHWRYKEGSRAERDYDAKLAWLRQLMDWQREVSDAQEFVEGIKLDIFQDQVFVFTPKGDIKDLPAGATPLDFAYRIHTDVGHRTIGSKVNNRLVPLDYRLRNGDIVEIVTTKAEHGPSRDWLSIVRTSHAREKIRQWFKKKDRDENIVHGKEALERELKRLARTTPAAIGHDRLLEVAKHQGQETLDDFYAAIGYGAISAQSVVMRLGVVDDGQLALPVTAPTQARTGGVRVKGVGDLLVRFGKCCHPIPGDPIVGFITRGKGVTVHLEPLPDRRERARGGPPHRRRVGGRAGADLPDRDPGRGPRPDRAPQRHRRRRRGEQGQHRGGERVGDRGPHRDRGGDAPGRLGLPAGAGHGPPRAGQGRALGPARPGLAASAPRLRRETPGAWRAPRRRDLPPMPTFRAPRGTRDLLPADRAPFARLERIARDLAARYGYREIETPLFEQGAVFERGIGEVTDVVEKELFRVDAEPRRGARALGAAARGDGRDLPCLRRARHADLAAAGEADPASARCSATTGPRRAATASSGSGTSRRSATPGPAVDAEMIELGLRASTARPASPTSRSSSTRSATRPAGRPTSPTLAAYFGRHVDALPELERRRLATNPLRLLDSKEPAMAALIAAAPKITERLCDACAAHFAAVRAHLDALGVALPDRAGARPRPRLLHADDVRVLPAREPRASSRRSAAADATTAWSSCSAASRRRGSASRSGSTASSSPSRAPARPPAEESAPDRGRRRRRPVRHRRAPGGRHAPPRGGPRRPRRPLARASSGASWRRP